MRPYWSTLLTHFEKKGYVYNGLTIPFLIGSLEIIDPQKKLWTIEVIVESLNATGCTILQCSNINEFVVGSVNSDTQKHRHLYHRPCENILVTDSSLDHIKSYDDLIFYFNTLYKLRLTKKEFSRNQGLWTCFTDLDLQRINEAKFLISKEIDFQKSY